MSRHHGPFLLAVVVAVMGLAVYAVPFPGSLLLVGAEAAAASPEPSGLRE
jgi:hypothetical protein